MNQRLVFIISFIRAHVLSYTVYGLIGCLFEMRSVTLLPHVSSVIFLTLYLVCLFLPPNWHLLKSLRTVECAKFFAPSFSDFAMEVATLVSQLTSIIHTLFSTKSLLFVQPLGCQQLQKRQQLYDFDWLRNNGFLNNCDLLPRKRTRDLNLLLMHTYKYNINYIVCEMRSVKCC